MIVSFMEAISGSNQSEITYICLDIDNTKHKQCYGSYRSYLVFTNKIVSRCLLHFDCLSAIIVNLNYLFSKGSVCIDVVLDEGIVAYEQLKEQINS